MSRSRPAPFLEPPGSALAARLAAVRALAARSRRLAAAMCAGAAVLAVVSALTPPATAPVPGGATSPGLAPILLPAGAGTGAVAGAERVALTVRLTDPAETLLLRPGVHVEVIGGAPTGSAGTTDGAGDASILAPDAVVLVVPQPAGEAGGDVAGGGDGGLLAGSSATGDQGLAGVVVISVPPADAHRLAAAAGSRPLTVTVALPGA